MKGMLDLIIESLPPTSVDNYRSLCTFGIQLFKNKGICELILSIITILELKECSRGILQIIENIILGSALAE
ncbi:hypothetical protein RCL_jg23922.t1 [Rhizophagus clarus]|uniref:Uncharacterized protein n=1 Tax=Rhizophagus clarus TaxID=94130 RepID=A0A8H3LPC9_9GLOM|nr:hypothetical protein RCL_jg23922.t1 [Rhizophagus clarus]